MDKKSARIRIGDLLDVCSGCPKNSRAVQSAARVDSVCGGCAVFEELKIMRNVIESEEHTSDKCKKIIAKGRDMTKSDIGYLLNKGFTRKEIRKALKMQSAAFLEMLRSFGFIQSNIEKEVEEVLELTKESYVEYKKNGMKDKEIMEKYGLHAVGLSNWKRKNFKAEEIKELSLRKQSIKNLTGKKEENPLPPEKAPEPKQHILATKTTEEKRHISDSKSFEGEFHQALAELKELKDACSDLEEENANLHSTILKRNSEIDIEKQRVLLLTDDVRLLESENYALRELVKLWI